MLFDSRNEQKDVTINVDNTIQEAHASGLQKASFYIIMILLTIPTIGLIWLWPMRMKNAFNEMQVDVQEASSTIQAAQAKRRATLIKMIDSVRGYRNHEQETLEQITKYRSQINNVPANPTNIQQVQTVLDKVTRGLQLTIERYPDLKASSLYMQFSNEVTLQEDEIYAARRIYNSKVRYFNSQLYVWPKIVIADNMKLHNMPFFEATATERQDVDTSGLL